MNVHSFDWLSLKIKPKELSSTRYKTSLFCLGKRPWQASQPLKIIGKIQIL